MDGLKKLFLWIFVERSDAAGSLILLGMILSVSLVIGGIAKRWRIPQISLLVLFGVAIAVFQQVILQRAQSDILHGAREPLIQLALVMVAFLLGSELRTHRLRALGKAILTISLVVVCVSMLVVGVGLWCLGWSWLVALSLAAVSAATDPAAVSETIRTEENKTPLAAVLLGIVAIDDAWGILLFGLTMAFLGWVVDGSVGPAFRHALWELGGAVVLGLVLGGSAAWLTGRLDEGKPTLVEAVALILLLVGFSSALGVSALLASMVCGAMVANLATHHTQSFREIEHIEWPFLVFFFVFSGARVDVWQIKTSLSLLLAYIALRLLGRWIGGALGVLLLQAKSREMGLPKHIGLALTPQAGVAMGLALLAAERFPSLGGVLFPVIAATVFFETIGPFGVRYVLLSAEKNAQP